MSMGCLEGVRVVEYGRLVAAPYCGKLLADLGAEVIKVEDTGRGDPARHIGPYAGDVVDGERSLLYLHLNTNKRSVTLNLETEGGRDLLRELLRDADVFIEDLAPREAERLELDYAHLEGLNPRLIVAAITPFGSTGPYRDYRAEDLNLYMYGGDGFTNPGALAYDLAPDREPLKLPRAAGDCMCGTTAALAIAAALFVQPMVGGQFLDLSKQEAHVSVMHRFQMRSYLTGGMYETRVTNRHAYGDCVPCKDGYIVVYAAQNHHWKMLVELMGSPAWALDPEFETQPGRAKRGDEIQQGITEWALQHTAEEIYRTAQKAGAPIGMFLGIDGAVQSEHERARGYFVEAEHPVAGKAEYPFQLFRATETPPQFRSAAPLLGQHNAEVYGRLGCTESELAEMERAGVI
jgi:crotonobetainyl-CoA:carnitine CoA-transferase CaiB-like acyl-CoA transferase